MCIKINKQVFSAEYKFLLYYPLHFMSEYQSMYTYIYIVCSLYSLGSIMVPVCFTVEKTDTSIFNLFGQGHLVKLRSGLKLFPLD